MFITLLAPHHHWHLPFSRGETTALKPTGMKDQQAPTTVKPSQSTTILTPQAFTVAAFGLNANRTRTLHGHTTHMEPCAASTWLNHHNPTRCLIPVSGYQLHHTHHTLIAQAKSNGLMLCGLAQEQTHGPLHTWQFMVLTLNGAPIALGQRKASQWLGERTTRSLLGTLQATPEAWLQVECHQVSRRATKPL